jgi:hypothetical protein
MSALRLGTAPKTATKRMLFRIRLVAPFFVFEDAVVAALGEYWSEK